MAQTKYTYSISGDTLNGDLVSDKLKLEINAQGSGVNTTVDYIDTLGDFLDIYMADILPDDIAGASASLAALVAAHDGVVVEEVVVKLNKEGIQLVDMSASKLGLEGTTSLTLATHDFGDKTTWYQKSIRVADEALTTSDSLTYDSANNDWVDIHSKKLIYGRHEVQLKDGTLASHSDFEVIVKVDDVVQTSGYTVNFSDGSITFDSSQSGTIKATYSHIDGVVNSSEFILSPRTGKCIVMEHVEVQFSKATTFNSPIRFEIWAGGTIAGYEPFNDTMYDAGYGQKRLEYQSFQGLINHGNQGTGEIPAMQDLISPTVVFPFKYIKGIEVCASLGVLLRISLVDDIAVSNADIATCTIYGEIKDE